MPALAKAEWPGLREKPAAEPSRQFPLLSGIRVPLRGAGAGKAVMSNQKTGKLKNQITKPVARWERHDVVGGAPVVFYRRTPTARLLAPRVIALPASAGHNRYNRAKSETYPDLVESSVADEGLFLCRSNSSWTLSAIRARSSSRLVRCSPLAMAGTENALSIETRVGGDYGPITKFPCRRTSGGIHA
jgi:hypothetical protein